MSSAKWQRFCHSLNLLHSIHDHVITRPLCKPHRGRQNRHQFAYHISHAFSWTKFIMMTLSNENIFRVTGLLCGEFIGPPQKGQGRGALMFSLICTWINSWVNNPEAGDLRCHRAHCDVSVMFEFHWNMFPVVQMMAWRPISDKPISKPMLAWHIHRPQKVYERFCLPRIRPLRCDYFN